MLEKQRIEDQPNFIDHARKLQERLTLKNKVLAEAALIEDAKEKQKKLDEIFSTTELIKHHQNELEGIFFKGLQNGNKTDLWDFPQKLDQLIDLQKNKHKYRKIITQKIKALEAKQKSLKDKRKKNESRFCFEINIFSSEMGKVIATGGQKTFAISIILPSIAIVGLILGSIFFILNPFAAMIMVCIGLFSLGTSTGLYSLFKTSKVRERQAQKDREYENKLIDNQRKINDLKKLLYQPSLKSEEPAKKSETENKVDSNEETRKELIHFFHQLEMKTETVRERNETYLLYTFTIPTSLEKSYVDKMIRSIKLITHFQGSYDAGTLEFHQRWLNTLKNDLYPKNQIKKALGEDYFIKSIRSDSRDFFESIFLWEATRSETQKENFDLRFKNKCRIRVNGDGVHESPNNRSAEKYNGKNPFSQSQSTSLVTGDFPSPSHEQGRLTVLTGIAVKKSDVHLGNFISIYDISTARRNHHFQNKNDAQDFFDKMVLGEHRNLFSRDEFDDFKVYLTDPNRIKDQDTSEYSELLTGVRWNTDGSSFLTIINDNLESRLIVLYRAKILLERLKKQAIENGTTLDPNYEVPIIFYDPNNKGKHLTYYDVFAQKNDLRLSKEIAKDKDKRQERIGKREYAFLLHLDHDELMNVLKECDVYDQDRKETVIKNTLIDDLISSQHLGILVPILMKMNEDEIEKRIIWPNGRLNTSKIINLFQNHAQSYYPGLIDHIFNFGGYENHQLALQLMCAQKKLHPNADQIIQKYLSYITPSLKTNNDDTARNLFGFLNDLSDLPQVMIDTIFNHAAFKDYFSKLLVKYDIEQILKRNIIIFYSDFLLTQLSPEQIKILWFKALKNNDTHLIKKLISKDPNIVVEKNNNDKTVFDSIDWSKDDNHALLKLLIENVKDFSIISDTNIKNIIINGFIVPQNFPWNPSSPNPDTHFITKLINNPTFLAWLDTIQIERLLTHCIIQNKYKNVKTLLNNLLSKIQDPTKLKDLLLEKYEDLSIIRNKRLMSFLDCLKFFDHFHQREDKKNAAAISNNEDDDKQDINVKIPLAITLNSIKHLEIDMLQSILQLLKYDKSMSDSIIWAFNVIKNPSKVYTIPPDKQKAYKVVKNMVNLLGDLSQEEKDRVLRLIQYKYGFYYHHEIVGHFRGDRFKAKMPEVVPSPSNSSPQAAHTS